MIYKTPGVRYKTHITFNMASLYLILALLVQCSLSYADVQSVKNETESIVVFSEVKEVEDGANDCEILKNTSGDIEEEIIKGFRTATNEWIDTFVGSDLYPSASTSLMSEATNSNKSPEEQLIEIKEVASEITMAIQNEVTNLLSYALGFADKDLEDNGLRRRRSVETPMDSSQLVMKLLQHIKSNNEFQNIAIEKMMSAQEIADKFGIEFNPDPEILTDLAFAANEQAKELTSILIDACDLNNSSCELLKTDVESGINWVNNSTPADNTTYYVYSIDPDSEAQVKTKYSSQSHEHSFQPHTNMPSNHYHHGDNYLGYNYYSLPYETQMAMPPVQYSHGPPVSAKPTFYDTISYNPNEYYMPYCSMDQMAYPSVFPFDEPEPELVKEEYEETVSSRVIIEQDDEPGSATVNHVMTYTVSEKAHFKSPEIEKLPQQMQYYFLLM